MAHGRKRCHADGSSVEVKVIDQVLRRIQSNTILTIALILLFGFNVGYFLPRFPSESQKLFDLMSGNTLQVTWMITL